MMPDEELVSSANFAGQPQTIGELRAERSSSAADWSPRDVLVSMLRDIDSGKLKVSDLVIAYRVPVENRGHKTWVDCAVKDPMVALGLAGRAVHLFNRDLDGKARS